MASYEDCCETIDALYQSALRAAPDTAFWKFLEFAHKFSHMSVFNATMVMIQRPGSILAATRKQWASVGRGQNPDAVPIIVLRPFGPLNFVYDYDDTYGTPLPFPETNPFIAIGDVSERLLERITARVQTDGIRVEQTDQYGIGLAGTAAALGHMPELVAGSEFRWRVRINRRHVLAVRFATLAHELGHVYCGHIGGHPSGRWPDRSVGLSLAQREMEAEAVAWIVCLRNGIEPNSADYLHQHAPLTDLQSISMWAILAAANRIEPGQT